MRGIVLAAVFVLFGGVFSQVNADDVIQGPAFGQIVSVDESRSEITLSGGEDSATRTFLVKLPKPEKQANQTGTSRPLALSDLPVGHWISLYYKTKEKHEDGKWVLHYTIVSLRLLGPDTYSLLRAKLQLPESTTVVFSPDTEIPHRSPIKLYASFEVDSQRQDLEKWVANWNKKQSAEHVAVELVNSVTDSQVSLITYRLDPVKPSGTTFAVSSWTEFIQTRPTYSVFLLMSRPEGVVVLSTQIVKTLNNWFLSSITRPLQMRLLEMKPTAGP
ncbi:MAG: hypothetical protein ABIP75_20620 [Pyrinomonadaceae bacterium]